MDGMSEDVWKIHRRIFEGSRTAACVRHRFECSRIVKDDYLANWRYLRRTPYTPTSLLVREKYSIQRAFLGLSWSATQYTRDDRNVVDTADRSEAARV